MGFYDLLIGPFVEFGFMRRALAGCLVLASGAAPIGVFLMLRRMSLIGDAMAHAILPGAAAGYLLAGFSLGAMTVGGLVAGFAVAVLAGIVARTTTLKEDAALAGFYILSLAAGVTLLSARGSNVDVLRVLFGSVLALDDPTLWLMLAVTTITLISLSALFRGLVLDSVDPGFFASVSRSAAALPLVFLGIVVINLVSAFHALGTLLAVGILILPAASARLWSNDLTRMIALAWAFATLASLVGLIASYHFGLASGPTIILAAGMIYVLSLAFGRTGGIVRTVQPSQHLKG
ncbi:MAG TPA: metal ABC transporter permease [Beijerinckiaceae bacterium]|nr:metal ABC transporter permease [Beijerinckiaceae bacterium]